MSVIHFLILIGVGAVLGAPNKNKPEKVYYDLDDAAILFEKYVKEFDKVYESEEYQVRLEIFKENLRTINEDNARTNLTVYGINQFADLTNEEFTNTYLMNFVPDSNNNKVDYVPVGNAPAELDYRQNGYVTPVKDQGQCGACYAFSATGNIEGQHAKKYNQLISVSEQQAIDCDTGSGGCSGGSPDSVMQALASQGGSMSEDDYPYEGQQGTCRTDSSKIAVKVTGGSELNVNGEDDLKDSLANTGPLSIAIYACVKFQNYNGGIFHFDCTGNKANHAVLLVGYGSENGEDYWIIKNSWGEVWGEQGYMRMKRGVGLCLIGGYVATATVE